MIIEVTSLKVGMVYFLGKICGLLVDALRCGSWNIFIDTEECLYRWPRR